MGAGAARAQGSRAVDLQQLVREQQRQIWRLQQRIEELEKAREGLRRPATHRLQPSDPRLQTPERKVEELQKERQTAESEAVTTGSFPGWFGIPGGDASIEIGGYVKADPIDDVDDVGSEDLFVTNSIRTEGKNRPGRKRLHARQTRLDVREPTEWGPARAFVEGDFFGAGGDQNVEFGCGLTSSGSLELPRLHAEDELGFQVSYGDGIGRYITDPGGGGFDARVDDDGDLDRVRAFGVIGQVQHWWADTWRSTLACATSRSPMPVARRATRSNRAATSRRTRSGHRSPTSTSGSSTSSAVSRP